MEDPPARIPYKSLYSDSSTREEGAGKGNRPESDPETRGQTELLLIC